MINFKNLNYVFLTIGLLGFLIIPFFIKVKNPGLEIFPSVIMPAGAGLIHKNDSITFRTYELYAKKNDTIRRLNVKEFLKPIPEWYLSHIARSNFGLDSFSQEIKWYKPALKFNNFNRFNNSELKNTEKFYQDRLKSLGFDDSILIYKNYKFQIRDSFHNKILVREKIYRFE